MVKRVFQGSVCVVGRGRWGSSLLAALRASGARVLAADPRNFSKPGRIPAWVRADLFWLCVPDAEIATAAREILDAISLARGSARGRILLHSSGVYSGRILEFAAGAGALIGSIHPMMSFPTRKPVSLAAVPFAVEARAALRPKLFRLVRQLEGRPFTIAPEGKALYHAAAVMASPLLTSLAAAASELAALSGLSAGQARELLQPIMLATLRNYFSDGLAKSFSGPFARGDAKTVSLHLAALQPHPQLERIYRSLALHALEALPVKNSTELRLSLKTNNVL